MTVYIRLFAIVILLSSCKSSVEKDIIVDCKYIGDSNYLPDRELDLRNGNVHLAFESEFYEDTVFAKYGNTKIKKVISTDNVTGFADDFNLGRLKRCDHLTIRINQFKPVQLKVDKENQAFLINLNDSVLQIRSRYYLPGYR